MAKEEKKVSKKAKIIGNSIFFTIITIMVTFFVWNFIDIKSGYQYPIFGTRTSVIVSPSMSQVNDANVSYITEDMKQIQTYDVVTTVNYKSFDEIQIYDIATYYTGSKDLVCHRVVNKYVDETTGIKYVVFRGDANNMDDAPVSYDLVRGKVVSITPKAGHVVAFIQSPYLFIAIFGTIFFVALGIFIIDLGKGKKKEKAQEQQPAQETKKPVEEPKPTPVVEPEPEKVQPVEEQKVEEVKEQPKVEEASDEEKKEPVKKAPKKTAPKATAKKTEPKSKEEPKEEKKPVNFRNYHVSKRADGKWQVKYAGGQKAIKLFDTQKEAMEYTKVMAENQGGSVLLHNSKGANKGRIKKK